MRHVIKNMAYKVDIFHFRLEAIESHWQQIKGYATRFAPKESVNICTALQNNIKSNIKIHYCFEVISKKSTFITVNLAPNS